MTPKFFAFLWIVFLVSAGILWLADPFTLMTLIVFGFLAFGLVFTGMMCVLPGIVSHPPIKTAKEQPPKKSVTPEFNPGKASAARLQTGLDFQ